MVPLGHSLALCYILFSDLAGKLTSGTSRKFQIPGIRVESMMNHECDEFYLIFVCKRRAVRWPNRLEHDMCIDNRMTG